MAGSANDLLRSRNAEKLQPGTKNRHRTQPWTNRVHNLVGERGHTKSLICHTEWSDQRQENDVIELIRAPFPCCRPVFGDLPCDRSNVRFSVNSVIQLSVKFHTPRQHTHMGHIHRLCVTAHRSQSKRSTHTLHDIIRLLLRAPFTLFQTSPCAQTTKRVQRERS